MAGAKKGDLVKVHYKGRLSTGVLFDSSEGCDPLEFRLGSGCLIPGFEEAVIGMNPGESKTVKIPPEKGYGRYRDDRVISVDKKDLPEGTVPEVGMNLDICASNGVMVPAQITKIAGSTVTLDTNHPLSDQTLTFEIALVEIAESGEAKPQ